MLKRMKLPSSVAESLRESAPSDVNRLYRLSYLQSVAISQTSPADHALFQYATYFRAEQERDLSTQSQVIEILGQSAQEYDRAVFEIIRGRKILEIPATTISDIDRWRLTAATGASRRLVPYVDFLAAMAYRNGGFRDQSDSYFLKSAAGFFSNREYDRELASHLQRPLIELNELVGLRSYAQNVGNVKCFHIANFALAVRYFEAGNKPEARKFCVQAIRGFRYDFLDPRRERIALSLMARINRLAGATTLENKLLELLAMGPKTKLQLIEQLFEVQINLDQSWFDSHDTRFRSVLYRFNKKFPGVITKAGENYWISLENPTGNKLSRDITGLSQSAPLFWRK